MAMARHASPYEASPSPQPQPLTKRDVRRNRIMEKLQGMIDSFSSNQHQHYRAQLQAVQADMTLILRADPYSTTFADSAGGVLEDGGDEIRALVESMGAQLPGDEQAQRDYYAMAGSRYKEFVRQVNDMVEERDAELVALHNHYTSSVNELDRLTQQKLHQAEEEHTALTKTIRERLTQTITKRRNQLLRDKEQLDIADSNALLLNPSHFSINNPGSPPNGHANRKTRHLRHRAGSPNAGELDGNGKKKRKAAAMEEESNESPAPSFKPLAVNDALGGGRSPFKDAREKNIYTQYEAPAYSLERIFTEKELAMATETAKLATWRYFHQPESQRQEQGANGNGTAPQSADGELMDTGEEGEGAVATTEGANGSPPPAAAEMERSTSHQVLTRGGARANPLAALQDLANAAASERSAPLAAVNKDPFAPVVPTYHAVTRSEKSGAPAPGGVSNFDLESDFRMMKESAAPGAADPDAMRDIDDEPNAEHIRRQLLDQALGSMGVSQPYRLPLLDTGPALIGKGVERVPGTGFAPLMAVAEKARQAPSSSLAAVLRAGGEPMSRTTSAGGVSEAGNEPIGPRRGRKGQLV